MVLFIPGKLAFQCAVTPCIALGRRISPREASAVQHPPCKAIFRRVLGEVFLAQGAFQKGDAIFFVSPLFFFFLVALSQGKPKQEILRQRGA